MTFALIDEGREYAESAAKNLGFSAELQKVQEYLTMYVGLVLDPPKPEKNPTEAFLNKFMLSNPQYLNGSIWFDSRGVARQEYRPHVVDGAWQAYIVALNVERAEFMRINPRGEFYAQRVMKDDFNATLCQGMDYIQMASSVIEVIASGLIIAREIGWDLDSTADFVFHWTGLKGRKLSESVGVSHYYLGENYVSYDATAEAVACISLDFSHSALVQHVTDVLEPLFASFNGYEIDHRIVGNLVQQIINN